MKLGIVGTGMIVGEFLPYLAAFDSIKIKALCGTIRSETRIKELCDSYSIPLGTTDYSALLSSDVDVVYLGIPNSLHYDFALQALMANKNVIVEKPMASTESEAIELATLAKEKGLFLFEAISTKYLANYNKIKEWIPRLGDIKLVTANFSQRSSRYDTFKTGTIVPVFDPNKAGGALMDLNVYNLHYIVGLFGAPTAISYLANIERGIDTSGIATLSYPTFQAVSIAAKDCSAPPSYTIQGTHGFITQDTPANSCGTVTLHLTDGTTINYDENNCVHRMIPEFSSFFTAMQTNDLAFCYEMLEDSLTVSRLLTDARNDAGIVFPYHEHKNSTVLG